MISYIFVLGVLNIFALRNCDFEKMENYISNKETILHWYNYYV